MAFAKSSSAWPDHPRACGANPEHVSFTQFTVGSSPRMRGKPVGEPFPCVAVRIIPAHAGQTPLRRPHWRSEPDHPRACGANSRWSIPAPATNGSSPRMRGKPRRDRQQDAILRIIPAHAGQTRTAGAGRCGHADHPRACGANPSSLAICVVSNGSSPRMRGKPQRGRRRQRRDRIIPAHAGQTTPARPLGAPPSDHPRACGANVACSRSRMPMTGSSPRMRGKRALPEPIKLHLRIIPAHAGQTHPYTSTTMWASDHPRACGANVVHFAGFVVLHGSSPRMRGKRGFGRGGRRRLRIIPAHAGQTFR